MKRAPATEADHRNFLLTQVLGSLSTILFVVSIADKGPFAPVRIVAVATAAMTGALALTLLSIRRRATDRTWRWFAVPLKVFGVLSGLFLALLIGCERIMSFGIPHVEPTSGTPRPAPTCMTRCSAAGADQSAVVLAARLVPRSSSDRFNETSDFVRLVAPRPRHFRLGR